MSNIAKLLARPVDASALAAFRLFFGTLMAVEVGRYFSRGDIAWYYIEPRFHFTYEFFPFVAPLPGQGMVWLFGAMGLFALGIALGLFYKLSSLLFLLTYTYVFLLDKTPYNNHYYLIILLSLLLFCVDAQRWASLDRWRAATPDPETIPFWQLFILRAQIFIVYFYGGLAKLNSDWLMGEPMRMWLAGRADYPVLGPFFATEGAVYFFSYGGLLFDLSIGFLLLWPRTRWLALVGLLFFHLMNSWLFSIGIFPFLAIAATVLFVEPDWPRRIFYRFVGRWRNLAAVAPPLPPASSPLNGWTFSLVALYLALQIIIPLRHWLYPGEVSWTEEGHRFSWHMKLRDKEPRLELTITDPQTGQSWPANLKEDLTYDQIIKMASRPDMILQYAHSLRDKLRQTGPDQAIITANAWASLNGRPFQRLIDPTVNLAQVRWTPLVSAVWILPLQEKHPHSPEPILRSLVITVMLLANLGLALNIYSALRYSRNVKTVFARQTPFLAEGSAATPSLALPPVELANLMKVFSTLLPYLAILLSLTAWVITGQLIYVIMALAASLLAAGWGFYLASLRSLRFDHFFCFRASPLVGILTGLFLLMILIVKQG
jgi:vitamin K-dependent gamma-carboxylase